MLEPVAPFALPEPLPFGETRRVPLGPSPAPAAATRAATPTSACGCAPTTHWRWLAHALTVERLRALLPETADLVVTRHVLPNLRAVNFVIEGILGEGVAYQARLRPAGQGPRRMAALAVTSTFPEEFLS